MSAKDGPGEITGIWIDEAHLIADSMIAKLRGQLPPEHPIVARATTKSSHGTIPFAVDPQKSAA